MARRSFRPYHAVLIGVLVVFLAATYWTGCEVFARYQTNVVRFPELAKYSRWARMTRWMPSGLQRLATRVIVGRAPSASTADLGERVFRLEQVEKMYPYDSVLQLELARQLFNQFRLGRRAGPLQRIKLLEKSIEHNRKAFDTYFDVDAYNQMAWAHLELYAALTRIRSPKAADHLQAAIEGFERVLLLKPGDVVAMERLAYIHASLARAKKSRQEWNKTIAYAKQILEEEHDNTNGFYFLGLAYDNLGLQNRAAMYLFKTLNTPSTIPRERLLWKAEVGKIIRQLKRFGYIPDESPKKRP